MLDPVFNLVGPSSSMGGAAVLCIVNGPIREQIGLNSRNNLFGPGNRANSTIGRAIRLIISNVTGAATGVLDKGTLGHGGRYSWCVAEAEDASPWGPLHVERGYAADQSTVTVFAGISPIQTGVDASDLAGGFERALRASGGGQDELVLVISPEALGHVVEAGWSKQELRERLHERAPGVLNSPDGLTVVVAGGAAGGACAIIPLWGTGVNSVSTTREI
jgi:hypothetical protein